MAKELVKVNENLSISNCLERNKKTSQKCYRVHSIYVMIQK